MVHKMLILLILISSIFPGGVCVDTKSLVEVRGQRSEWPDWVGDFISYLVLVVRWVVASVAPHVILTS